MIIKKFSAPTMTEALAKVREELGADAIILNTRNERRGGVIDKILCDGYFHRNFFIADRED